MEKNHRAGGGADLAHAGEKIAPLPVGLRGCEAALVTARHDGEIALPWRGHVGEIVADLELEERDRDAEVAEAIVVAVDVPLALAVHEVAAVFHDRIGRAVVRHGAEQPVHVGHDRGPVQQLEKERVVVEEVEQPRALLAFRVGEARRFLLLRADQFAAPRDGAVGGVNEPRDMVRGEEILPHEESVGLKGEAFGLGEGKDRGGRGIHLVCRGLRVKGTEDRVRLSC